jgi:hypothetical protein
MIRAGAASCAYEIAAKPENKYNNVKMKGVRFMAPFPSAK